MTDLINSAPLAIRYLLLPRLRFPKLGLGTRIAAVSTRIAQAYSMAYAEPYKTRERRPLTFNNTDLEGRDPNW